jgi:hypothetical protein
MKLNKKQALLTFTALDFIACAVALVLMFTGTGANVSYWLLAAVVVGCEFGKYRARQMPEENGWNNVPDISSGGGEEKPTEQVEDKVEEIQ